MRATGTTADTIEPNANTNRANSCNGVRNDCTIVEISSTFNYNRLKEIVDIFGILAIHGIQLSGHNEIQDPRRNMQNHRS